MTAGCDLLHRLCSRAAKWDFREGFQRMPKNGIYLLFESGEIGHGTERIVRVGIHTGPDGLKRRIRQHFTVPNKNRSIFRKNIGRCMLNKARDPYLKVWDYAVRSKDAELMYGPEINKEKEKALEATITGYIQEHFSVAVIVCGNLAERERLESRIISTVSNCTCCGPGANWFGRYSTDERIVKSGLWQVQKLYKEDLSQQDLNCIEKNIVTKKNKKEQERLVKISPARSLYYSQSPLTLQSLTASLWSFCSM